MKGIILLVFASFALGSVAQGDLEIRQDRKCYENYDANGKLIPKGQQRYASWECGKLVGVIDCNEKLEYDQDADMVQFIHRAEYYGLTEDEDGNSTQGMATIIIAKHRNGSVGDVKLKLVYQLDKFEDFEQGSNDFGDFDNAAMPIGDDFDSPTVPSKMNDIDNFNYGVDKDDDAPF